MARDQFALRAGGLSPNGVDPAINFMCTVCVRPS
jgi:hypothetical protein